MIIPSLHFRHQIKHSSNFDIFHNYLFLISKVQCSRISTLDHEPVIYHQLDNFELEVAGLHKKSMDCTIYVRTSSPHHELASIYCGIQTKEDLKDLLGFCSVKYQNVLSRIQFERKRPNKIIAKSCLERLCSSRSLSRRSLSASDSVSNSNLRHSIDISHLTSFSLSRFLDTYRAMLIYTTSFSSLRKYSIDTPK